MIEQILTAAGKPYRKSRFIKPPTDETYTVYTDDVTADGPDGINRIFTHDIAVEVYEVTPDDEYEAALEAELNARGIRYDKQDRYWLREEQRYQVVYSFSYIIKI